MGEGFVFLRVFLRFICFILRSLLPAKLRRGAGWHSVSVYDQCQVKASAHKIGYWGLANRAVVGRNLRLVGLKRPGTQKTKNNEDTTFPNYFPTQPWLHRAENIGGRRPGSKRRLLQPFRIYSLIMVNINRGTHYVHMNKIEKWTTPTTPAFRIGRRPLYEPYPSVSPIKSK